MVKIKFYLIKVFHPTFRLFADLSIVCNCFVAFYIKQKRRNLFRYFYFVPSLYKSRRSTFLVESASSITVHDKAKECCVKKRPILILNLNSKKSIKFHFFRQIILKNIYGMKFSWLKKILLQVRSLFFKDDSVFLYNIYTSPTLQGTQ